MTKNVVFSEQAPRAIGPYSQAIDCGNLLFVSGQLPVDPITGNVPLDIKAQTKQSLENMKAIIMEAGYSMKDVAKTTVFISDMNLFQQINEVYENYFAENSPARACIEVARLPKDVGVEIEAIVYKA